MVITATTSEETKKPALAFQLKKAERMKGIRMIEPVRQTLLNNLRKLHLLLPRNKRAATI
jgi:hypothetical protein